MEQKSAVLGLQAVCAALGISIEHTPHSPGLGLQSGDKAVLVTDYLHMKNDSIQAYISH